MSTGLIVIDVQNAFVKRETAHLPRKIAQYIARRADSYALIVFTRYVNTPDSPAWRLRGWYECTNSPDTDFAPELSSVLQFGRIFQKDTYSALKAPRLLPIIRKHKISRLDLCGIDTDYCLLATAFEAFDLGFATTVLPGLSGSTHGKEAHRTALRLIRRTVGQTRH